MPENETNVLAWGFFVLSEGKQIQGTMVISWNEDTFLEDVLGFQTLYWKPIDEYLIAYDEEQAMILTHLHKRGDLMYQGEEYERYLNAVGDSL